MASFMNFLLDDGTAISNPDFQSSRRQDHSCAAVDLLSAAIEPK